MDNGEKYLKLKLSGKSLEDLKVFSAYLQDSVVLVKDIVFLKKNKIFLMLVNRFMWEDLEKGVFRSYKRIRSAIKFNSIIKAKSKNINQRNSDRALELLAIKPKIDNEKIINIIFSGDAVISIQCESIDIFLDDQGKSWEVKSPPKHKI